MSHILSSQPRIRSNKLLRRPVSPPSAARKHPEPTQSVAPCEPHAVPCAGPARLLLRDERQHSTPMAQGRAPTLLRAPGATSGTTQWRTSQRRAAQTSALLVSSTWQGGWQEQAPVQGQEGKGKESVSERASTSGRAYPCCTSPPCGLGSLSSASLSVHRLDPFLKKEWYDIKAPSNFSVRSCGKTPVTRTTGTSTPLPCPCS